MKGREKGERDEGVGEIVREAAGIYQVEGREKGEYCHQRHHILVQLYQQELVTYRFIIIIWIE